MNDTTEIKMNLYGTIATVNGVDYKVTNIHGFDDFGHTLDTATLEGTERFTPTTKAQHGTKANNDS